MVATSRCQAAITDLNSYLRARFPEAQLWSDVSDLAELPPVDLVTAGFPCQDLSIAGRAAGIGGSRSGLVEHVFRLIDSASQSLRWLLFENVPFLLRLHKGTAMTFLVQELERRGYRWAYRVVDTRAFGLPQRRQRVLMLASRTEDPRAVLFGEDAGEPSSTHSEAETAFGFYWTEGHRGVGWSADCIPPMKVGSGLGIPSPPAIWMPDGSIVKPSLRDAERLQGFDVDWTKPAETEGKSNVRWRLLGNAVSVPVAEWVGGRLRAGDAQYDDSDDWPVERGTAWPTAAWGHEGLRYHALVSMWPVRRAQRPLATFLQYPGVALSPRGAAGLMKRLQTYGARVPRQFMVDLAAHACSEDRPIERAAG